MILIVILTETSMGPVEQVFIVTVILLLFVHLNLLQFVVFRLLKEQWADKCLTVLKAPMIKGRN